MSNLLGKKLRKVDELNDYGLALVENRGLANSLAKNMKQKHITLTDLSFLTGISKQLVHNIINGKNVPGVDIAIKISKVLDVPIDELFYFEEDFWTIPCKEDGKRLYVDKKKLEIVSEEKVDEYNDKDRFVKLGKKISIN